MSEFFSRKLCITQTDFALNTMDIIPLRTIYCVFSSMYLFRSLSVFTLRPKAAGQVRAVSRTGILKPLVE